MKVLKFQYFPTTMMSGVQVPRRPPTNAVVSRVSSVQPLTLLAFRGKFSPCLATSLLFPTIPKMTHYSISFHAKVAKKWIIFAMRKPRQNAGAFSERITPMDNYGNFQLISLFSFFVGRAYTFAILVSMSPFHPFNLYASYSISNSLRCSGVA